MHWMFGYLFTELGEYGNEVKLKLRFGALTRMYQDVPVSCVTNCTCDMVTKTKEVSALHVASRTGEIYLSQKSSFI